MTDASLEAVLEFQSEILKSLTRSDLIIILFDKELKVHWFNAGAKNFFEDFSIKGKSLFDLFPHLNKDTVEYYLANDLVYPRSIHRFDSTDSNSNPFPGQEKYLNIEILPLHYEGERWAILFGFEITECVEMIEHLEEALKIDKLTGLLTFYSLLEEAQRILLAKPRYSAMIVLDLYRFSAINDLCGIKAGDKLLREVAERLKKAFEASVLIGRSSADEFIIFIPHLEHRKTLLQYLDYINLIFEIPFTYGEETFSLNYNLGIAIYPYDGTTSETLYQRAHAACSLSKSKGPNQVQFFDPKISEYLQEQLSAEQLINQSLTNHWFTFFIQPYFHSDTFILAGGESLVRIVKPDGTVIPPGNFIQALERSIYLEKFEKWAFKTIVHLVNTLRIPLSLNLYPETFYNKKFFMEREKELQSLSAPLMFEITERATFESPEKARDIINWLKNFPMVRIALDDFGTGYSNLSLLKDLSIDVIKIDISFVRELKNNQPKSKQIVKTIIDLAHSIGAKALAEGVETTEQVELLRELKCDYLQGFYFDKPLPLDEFTKKYLSEPKTKA